MKDFRDYVRILCRDTTEGIEFLIVTAWKLFEDISRFAGGNIAIAVVPVYVQTLMIRYDHGAIQYEVQQQE